MSARLADRIRRTGTLLRNVAHVASFVAGDAGAQYGVGMLRRWKIVGAVRRNARQPGSAASFLEHLTLVEALLRVPRELQGDVAEFGCFKGMATASLSLVCALIGRKLRVFDSFEGLPAPDEAVHNIDTGAEVKYKQGDYAGSLDEVRANVAKFGRIDVCEFVRGFFSDTLPQRPRDERYVLIFEDADLVSSARDVLTHAWPRLQPGCIFFCHEARDTEVVALFFDRNWWRQTMGTDAPGLIGSGEGLPLSANGSSLSYVRKANTER